MKIDEFFKKNNLDKSFIIGYYGDGNLGDELLLEVITNLLFDQSTFDVKILYSNPEDYNKFHRDFGYKIVNSKKGREMIIALLKSKNIIIGGGGLWGLDFNKNIFFLSVLLLFSKLLGKNVYMIGIGYYNSVNFFGRISAFFAGLASKMIIVRDKESNNNFSFFKNKVDIDYDISFILKKISLNKYYDDFLNFEKKLELDNKKIIFLSIRGNNKNYEKNIINLIENNTDKNFLISSLVYYKRYKKNPFLFFLEKYKNVKIIDYNFNPIFIYLLFFKNKNKFLSICPQYHGIALSYLSKIPFFPLSYDNKCSELLHCIGINSVIHINKVDIKELQNFIDFNYV